MGERERSLQQEEYKDDHQGEVLDSVRTRGGTKSHLHANVSPIGPTMTTPRAGTALIYNWIFVCLF